MPWWIAQLPGKAGRTQTGRKLQARGVAAPKYGRGQHGLRGVTSSSKSAAHAMPGPPWQKSCRRAPQRVTRRKAWPYSDVPSTQNSFRRLSC